MLLFPTATLSVLPNCLAPLIVQTSLSLATAILDQENVDEDLKTILAA